MFILKHTAHAKRGLFLLVLGALSEQKGLRGPGVPVHSPAGQQVLMGGTCACPWGGAVLGTEEQQRWLCHDSAFVPACTDERWWIYLQKR